MTPCDCLPPQHVALPRYWRPLWRQFFAVQNRHKGLPVRDYSPDRQGSMGWCSMISRPSACASCARTREYRRWGNTAKVSGISKFIKRRASLRLWPISSMIKVMRGARAVGGDRGVKRQCMGETSQAPKGFRISIPHSGVKTASCPLAYSHDPDRRIEYRFMPSNRPYVRLWCKRCTLRSNTWAWTHRLNFVYSLAKPERADQYEVSASFREDDALICKNEKIYFHMQYIGA